jgi:hypothetical protein
MLVGQGRAWQSGRGRVRPGTAWLGGIRQGLARCGSVGLGRHGAVRLGRARKARLVGRGLGGGVRPAGLHSVGQVWLGSRGPVWRGRVRFVLVGSAVVDGGATSAWSGGAGVARHGMGVFGQSGLGKATLARRRGFGGARLGRARHEQSWSGASRRGGGVVRLGRLGLAGQSRLGLAWRIFGTAVLGMAAQSRRGGLWLGATKASPGAAVAEWRGRVGSGGAGSGRVRRVHARLGSRGLAGLGRERMAGQGGARRSRRDGAGRGPFGFGMAGHGAAVLAGVW